MGFFSFFVFRLRGFGFLFSFYFFVLFDVKQENMVQGNEIWGLMGKEAYFNNHKIDHNLKIVKRNFGVMLTIIVEV